MKRPELVNATQAELDEILVLTKATLPAQQYQLLERVLGTFVFVMQSLQNARTSIKRFRQMLFGARTESKANVLSNKPPNHSVQTRHRRFRSPCVRNQTQPACPSAPLQIRFPHQRAIFPLRSRRTDRN